MPVFSAFDPDPAQAQEEYAMNEDSSNIEDRTEDLQQGSTLWKLMAAGSIIFFLAAVFFQPYSLPAAFRPDITGWVFIFSNYPWPAAFMSASSFEFAQMHIWGIQILVGVIMMIAVKPLKGKI